MGERVRGVEGVLLIGFARFCLPALLPSSASPALQSSSPPALLGHLVLRSGRLVLRFRSFRFRNHPQPRCFNCLGVSWGVSGRRPGVLVRPVGFGCNQSDGSDNDNDNEEGKIEVQDICHRHSTRNRKMIPSAVIPPAIARPKTDLLLKFEFIKLFGICEVTPPLFPFLTGLARSEFGTPR